MKLSQCFTMTGTLNDLTRAKAVQRIEEAGATYSSSITRKTTFLIVGKNPGHKKLKDAVEKNIARIDEIEFLAMVGVPHTGRLPGF